MTTEGSQLGRMGAHN